MDAIKSIVSMISSKYNDGYNNVQLNTLSAHMLSESRFECKIYYLAKT